MVIERTSQVFKSDTEIGFVYIDKNDNGLFTWWAQTRTSVTKGLMPYSNGRIALRLALHVLGAR